jgi:hypothetical protein
VGVFFNVPIGPIAGATAAQPYSNHKLPPSLETVPSPPFVQRGRAQQIISLNASIAQPNPWVYTWEARVGRKGPFQPQQLPPSTLLVPNPPFISPAKNPNSVYVTPYYDQVVTWPYTYFDNTTGAQPYGHPTPVPPSTPVVITQTPYANQWMASVIQSWFVDQPRPQQPRYAVVQQNVIPSTTIPYSVAWMSGVVRAWFPEPPAPILPVKSNVDDLVVGNPPVIGNSRFWLDQVVNSWVFPPPAPILPTYSNPANLIVPNPPIIGAYRWQPPYPDTFVPPQPQHYQVQGAAPIIVQQSPYSNAWLATVVLSWFVDQPRPQQPKPGNPATFPNYPPPLVLPPVWANTPGIYQRGYELIYPRFGANNLSGVQPPTPPTPPVPPSSALFTVSGEDVRIYIVETEYDVVYEPAAITKETL